MHGAPGHAPVEAAATVIDAPLALAFTAGMVASINPCGFALLPAYVGAFVAGDDLSERADHRVVRALGVSLAVSIGFAITFVGLGLLIEYVSSEIRQQVPWITIALGIVMIVIGIVALTGRSLRLPIAVTTSTTRRDAVGMVGFGIVYALVSFSCTLGPFLAVTSFALDDSILSGIVTYGAYALGMGTVILALSVGAALAHESFVDALRSASRWAPRLAGVLLILSGAYAIWYGRYELAVFDGDVDAGDRLVDAGTNLQSRFLQLVEQIGAEWIALAVIAVTVLAWAVARRRVGASRATTADPAPDDAPTSTAS